jgi:CRISPR-associated endonuclease/helicase Cas3
MDPPRATSRQGYPDIATLLTQLNTHMATLQQNAESTPVNAIRRAVYRQCCDKAQSTPGLFSLTVPTGGGKTLSSLAFALHHAKRFGKRRVIYAIPYTSIIEQTADVFRDVFKSSEDVVVEHHSQADSAPETEDARSRLACENWDAPLIVTTNVQLFESLYAARTSRCRKLHNIVDSVVILDEAQMLPPEYLQTICSTIKLLSTHYGVTFVFCTATQPALNSRQHLGQVFTGLDQIEEIMDDVNTLYRQVQRVEMKLPEDLHTPVSWEALAEDLQQHASVLCIVNSRRDCRSFWKLMPAGTYHLSALMCGPHRSEKIKEIREKLAHGEPIRVISTQLIEAGVDVDFPVVYRALAGLDSIAQAAGRCNHNGTLPRLGQVQVFVPPSHPQGLLRRGKDKTQELLSGWEDDPLSPEAFQRYFSLFYGAVDTDKRSITTLTVVNEHGGLPFRTLAERFQLIDDEDQMTVFVRYGELLEQLRHQGPERWLMRKLQCYSVSLYQHDFRRLLQERCLEEVRPEIYTQVAGTRYDPDPGFGLDIALNPDDLII